MQEMWVQSLGWEDPLEKEISIHSSILAWRIRRSEEPSGLQSVGLQSVGHNWATNTFTNTFTVLFYMTENIYNENIFFFNVTEVDHGMVVLNNLSLASALKLPAGHFLWIPSPQIQIDLITLLLGLLESSVQWWKSHGNQR